MHLRLVSRLPSSLSRLPSNLISAFEPSNVTTSDPLPR